MKKYLLIALGGSLGSIARFWVGSVVSGRLGTRFPYGTLVINITACTIIGFSLEYLGHHIELTPAWRYLVPVGFVGAYSTFSTFEWELFSNVQIGSLVVAALYVTVSVIFGFVAVWAGAALAKGFS